MLQDLVSIIIPNYNGARYIAATLDSCLAQSYPHWEALVIDDGSSDESQLIIESYARNDSRIVPTFFPRNQGVSYARNYALTQAKGRFIAFLDADDIWESHKLEVQVRTMLDKSIALSYGGYRVINECGVVLGDFLPRARITYNDMLKTCQIGNSTAMYDREKVGTPQAGTIRHDYELWLFILRKHCAYIAPPKDIEILDSSPSYLACIRIHAQSDTYNKLKSARKQWQVYTEILRLPIYKSVYYFAHYTINGLIKHKSYRKSPKGASC